MKKTNMNEFSNAIRNLTKALGYVSTDKSIAELINELVAKNKSDSAVLKIREEECAKLRAKLNTEYGKAATAGMKAMGTVLNVVDAKVFAASHSNVVFSTPVGNVTITASLNDLNDVKYLRDVYNDLRVRLKDALNEIDKLREDLYNEHEERAFAECERDTDRAIIDSIHAHYSNSTNMDAEEFRDIIDYCREWI